MQNCSHKGKHKACDRRLAEKAEQLEIELNMIMTMISNDSFQKNSPSQNASVSLAIAPSPDRLFL